MSALYLQSEEALYFYFKRFLKTSGKAVQLDGSVKKKSNGKVMVIFQYSMTGSRYKLSGDLSTSAIKAFVHLVEQHGSATMALRELEPTKSGAPVCIDLVEPHKDWHCAPFIEKAHQKLKKAS